jgi:hypothetical protein
VNSTRSVTKSRVLYRCANDRIYASLRCYKSVAMSLDLTMQTCILWIPPPLLHPAIGTGMSEGVRQFWWGWSQADLTWSAERERELSSG